MPQLLEGLEVYLVGGAVRDRLLGLEVKDRDWVVVGTTPAEMEARGFKPVGHEFPVFLHPETKEEYALARTERKTGPGYKGFEFSASPAITLKQDLMRRDLTINAIAQTTDGTIIDPWGGRRDLSDGILRHVSAAFEEDPVRVLRVARFRARFGFGIAPETLEVMRAIVDSGETDALVAERVWQELHGALGESTPSLFFETLRECGALATVVPELDRLFGVPQNPEYHPEIDTGLHTMMVVDQAARISDDESIRFAALVHDLGKASTPREQWPRHHGHEQAGLPCIERMCERLRVPNGYRELALVACKTHLKFHLVEEMKPGSILDLLEAVDAFRRPRRMQQVLDVCEADYRGRTGYENKHYVQRDLVERCFAAAKGVDAAGIAKRHREKRRIADAIRRERCKAIKVITSGSREQGSP